MYSIFVSGGAYLFPGLHIRWPVMNKLALQTAVHTAGEHRPPCISRHSSLGASGLFPEAGQAMWFVGPSVKWNFEAPCEKIIQFRMVTLNQEGPLQTHKLWPLKLAPPPPACCSLGTQDLWGGALRFWKRSLLFSRSVVSYSLQPHGLESTKLVCPWNFPGKNARMGCHFLFWGIFST